MLPEFAVAEQDRVIGPSWDDRSVVAKGRRHGIASRIETVFTMLAAGPGDIRQETYGVHEEEMLLVARKSRKRPDSLSNLLVTLRDMKLRLVFVNVVIRFVSHNSAFRMMYDHGSPPGQGAGR